MTKKTKASLRTKREKSRRYQEESEDSNRPSRDEELYRMWSQKAHSDLLPSEIRKDRRELEGDDEEDELMAAEKEFNDDYTEEVQNRIGSIHDRLNQLENRSSSTSNVDPILHETTKISEMYQSKKFLQDVDSLLKRVRSERSTPKKPSTEAASKPSFHSPSYQEISQLIEESNRLLSQEFASNDISEAVRKTNSPRQIPRLSEVDSRLNQMSTPRKSPRNPEMITADNLLQLVKKSMLESSPTDSSRSSPVYSDGSIPDSPEAEPGVETYNSVSYSVEIKTPYKTEKTIQRVTNISLNSPNTTKDVHYEERQDKELEKQFNAITNKSPIVLNSYQTTPPKLSPPKFMEVFQDQDLNRFSSQYDDNRSDFPLEVQDIEPITSYNDSYFSHEEDTEEIVPSHISQHVLDSISFQDIIREVTETTQRIAQISSPQVKTPSSYTQDGNNTVLERVNDLDRQRDETIVEEQVSEVEKLYSTPKSTASSIAVNRSVNEPEESFAASKQSTPRTHSLSPRTDSGNKSFEYNRSRPEVYSPREVNSQPIEYIRNEHFEDSSGWEKSQSKSTTRSGGKRTPLRSSPGSRSQQYSIRYKQEVDELDELLERDDDWSPSKRKREKKASIAYSDVRHLNGHREGSYNHSTIDWYLNLCSEKYERTPSPAKKQQEVRVKWVGLKKNFRTE